MTRLTALLTAALTLGPGASNAEEVSLHLLRDVMAQGHCTLPFDPVAHEMPDLTVHEIPCRTTAHDVLSLLVAETAAGWMPLYFAQPSFDLRTDAEGRLFPVRDGQPTISTLALVSSPVIRAEANRVDLTHRIAPGLADAHLKHSYIVDEFGPQLTEAEVHQTGQAPLTLWPREPSVLEELGASFDLEGFEVQPTPDWVMSDPSQIATHLALDFPSVEEGRPRLEITLQQRGAQLTANVVNRGWADDSVSGVAYRVLMEQKGETWAVTGLGRANVCYRGPEVVTDGRCP